MSESSRVSAAPSEFPPAPDLAPSAGHRARAIFRSRRILGILIVRDLKVRYSGTVLGFAWTLLDPLLMTLVFWLAFGVIITRGSAEEQPYLLWLLTGILPFQWTSHVLGDSGRLLGNDAKLVTASSLPREIWVLRSVASRFVEFVFTLPITVVVLILFMQFGSTPITIGWIWLLAVPIAFAVQFVYNLGLALTLSPACMLYPDVHRVVRAFSRLYRFLSPVIYGLVTLEESLQGSTIWPEWMLIGDQTWPEWMLTLYSLNPMAGILNAYHAVLFPQVVDDVVLWLSVAAVISLLLFVVGWWIFRRLEAQVLKEL
jgi:ABC-2 type transport system permease protein